MTNEIRRSIYPKKNKLLFALYLILILGIGVLLFKKFYVKKNEINLKYGEVSTELMTLVEKTTQFHLDKKLNLLFFFNTLPDLTDIENISKLFNKHGNNCRFSAIFHKKFKSPFKLKFPHEFVPNSQTESHYMGKNYFENYVILLDNKKVNYVDTSMNSIDLNFLIEKHLAPGRDYNSYAISTEQLRKRLTKELKKGEIELMNLNDNKIKRFSLFNEYQKIYVVIAKCSVCELKTLVSDLKLRHVLDSRKTLVVFPIYANESQLSEIIKKEKVNFPIYLDYNDKFDLFSIITSPKEKLIVINREEIVEL